MARLPRLYRHENGQFHVKFRFRVNNKLTQFHKSLKTDDEKQAQTINHRILDTMQAIEKGYLEAPSSGDFWDFLMSGGKLKEKASVKRTLTLEELFVKYETERPAGTMENSTIETFRLHKKHLLRIIGNNSEIAGLRPQQYINQRSKETFRKKLIQAQTVKKELDTLRAVCNWAANPNQAYLDAAPTFTGLNYGKRQLKPPFMTWKEIEEKLAKGGDKSLWDCLFLDTEQIDESLAYVKQHAAYPFIYPMMCFIANTGARRSEMMRCRLEDLDLARGEVVLREKKRDKSVKETFRRAYLSPSLANVLNEWLLAHPGGPFLFCVTDTRYRGFGKQRTQPEPLTKNIARSHFERTFADSKWDVLKGFHVYRHSFASNLAAAGVDQRIIDELMGHQTDDMKKRYRHLSPQQLKTAVTNVYK